MSKTTESSSFRAALAFSVSAAVWSVALNVLNQKYGTSIPDWTIIIAAYIAAGFWLYWAWHTDFVKRHRRLVYTKPRMALAIMLIVGGVVGSGAMFLLWKVIQLEHARELASAASEKAKPSGSPELPFVAVSTVTAPLSPETELLRSNSAYFQRFLSEPRQLHKTIRTYSVLTRAEGKPRPYYIRLGAMDNGDIRYVLYVPHMYYLPDVLVEVMTHHERIAQDLKAEMKKDGTEVLGLSISRWIIGYLDAAPNEGVSLADVNAAAKANGFQYIIERKIA